jgi:hypothetical protein
MVAVFGVSGTLLMCESIVYLQLQNGGKSLLLLIMH